MSHFGVLVLADEALDRDEAEAYCAPVLAPYDENQDVDEHEVDCYCVGTAARVAAQEELRPEFSDERDERRAAYEELRREVLEAGKGEISGSDLPLLEGSAVAVLPDSKRKAELAERERVMDEEWEAFVARWNTAEKEAEKAHPLYRQPDPECEECGGSGRHRTTSNPRGYWDWWVVGGRWTGVLDPDYDPAQDPRNFGTCTLCAGTGTRPDADRFDEAWLEWSGGCNGCKGTGIQRHWGNAPHDSDVRPLAEVAEENVLGHFYAVVTPDGEWHQHGTMGWFGMSDNEMDEETWRAYVRSLLEAHPEATAIVVDCHV